MTYRAQKLLVKHPAFAPIIKDWEDSQIASWSDNIYSFIFKILFVVFAFHTFPGRPIFVSICAEFITLSTNNNDSQFNISTLVERYWIEHLFRRLTVAIYRTRNSKDSTYDDDLSKFVEDIENDSTEIADDEYFHEILEKEKRDESDGLIGLLIRTSWIPKILLLSISALILTIVFYFICYLVSALLW